MNLQKDFGYLANIRKYKKFSGTPDITMNNIISLATHKWILTGLNVNISYCNLGSTHLIIQNCPSPHNMVENPKFSIHNSSFGSLDLQPGTEALINECYIDAGFNVRPALITMNDAQLFIFNSHLIHFTNTDGPTIIQGWTNAIVMIDNVVLEKNYGLHGVIDFQHDGKLNIDSMTFTYNMAFDDYHSPITLNNGIEVQIQNSTFIGNQASRGGSIRAQWNSDIQCKHTYFHQNKAYQGGAVWAMDDSYIDLNDSYLYLNEIVEQLVNPSEVDDLFPEVEPIDPTDRDAGAAVFARNNVQLFLTNSEFYSNHGREGGAVYVWFWSHLEIHNCLFKNNTGFDAGALYLGESSTGKISYCLFERNSGACKFEGHSELSMNGVVFHDNLATSGYGGAMKVMENVRLRMANCSFVRNRALGGGVIGGQNSLHFQIQNCTFIENQAAVAGVIGILNHVEIDIESSTFSRNVATQFGGVLFISQFGTLHISSSSFTNNEADAGGVIMLKGFVNGFIESSDFSNNTSPINFAGVVGIEDHIIMHIQRSTFSRNFAGHRGGCIHVVNNVTLTILSSLFLENKARDEGGVVYTRINSTLQV